MTFNAFAVFCCVASAWWLREGESRTALWCVVVAASLHAAAYIVRG
jgi:hypothetical protein